MKAGSSSGVKCLMAPRNVVVRFVKAALGAAAAISGRSSASILSAGPTHWPAQRSAMVPEPLFTILKMDVIGFGALGAQLCQAFITALARPGGSCQPIPKTVTCFTTWHLNTKRVTTPKLPLPAPRHAQNRSALLPASAENRAPGGIDHLHRHQAVAGHAVLPREETKAAAQRVAGDSDRRARAAGNAELERSHCLVHLSERGAAADRDGALAPIHPDRVEEARIDDEAVAQRQGFIRMAPASHRERHAPGARPADDRAYPGLRLGQHDRLRRFERAQVVGLAQLVVVAVAGRDDPRRGRIEARLQIGQRKARLCLGASHHGWGEHHSARKAPFTGAGREPQNSLNEPSSLHLRSPETIVSAPACASGRALIEEHLRLGC